MNNEPRPEYNKVISLDFQSRTRIVHQDRDESSLKGGGGGGTSGGMEDRIARLESDMGHVKDTLKSLDARFEGVRGDVSGIKTDVATIKVKMDHLPGKGFIFVAAAGLLGAAGGLIAIVVRFIPQVG